MSVLHVCAKSAPVVDFVIAAAVFTCVVSGGVVMYGLGFVTRSM